MKTKTIKIMVAVMGREKQAFIFQNQVVIVIQSVINFLKTRRSHFGNLLQVQFVIHFFREKYFMRADLGYQKPKGCRFLSSV